MKLNWGSGIAIFYTLFVLVMIFMVIKSKQNQVHLVQENYYQKDLNYEDFRVKRQNAAQLTEKIQVEYLAKDRNIQLTFPQSMMEASGKVSLFRPSNKYLDKSYNIQLDKEAQMYIPVDRSLPAGRWKIKIDWESAGRKYYNEEDLVL